jgi:GH25 family lysozyme M1 (1,4-beta-N-acetylmuramidase)
MTDVVEHLIDISVYNAVNDWDAVRVNGIVGASIKVSQQVNYLNPACGAQVAGARGAGIAAGGYHFGDPRVSAAQQAKFFVDNARPFGLFDDGALAPMYDAENWEGGGLIWPNPKTLNAHIAEHIRVVREETGVRRHLVYGSLSWWQSKWIDPDVWADDDVLLWVAVYNGQPGDLQGWDHPNDALHQHTSSGIVTGIPGRVDKNTTLRGRRIGDLVIKQEDDMQLSDRMQNAWGGTPTLEEVFRYIDLRSAEAAEGVARIELGQKVQNDVLAGIAQDANITPDRLQAMIDTSIQEGLTNMQAGLVAIVRSAVGAELGEDNKDQAARIVDEVSKRLAAGAAPAPGQGQ